jgi:glycoside/pentoside/hexuronide:cation symporter, GPH family
VATAVPRFLDILIDPLIGHASDNTRSRWGRRKPWMLVGAVGSGGIVMGLWHPPLAHGPTAVFVFLAVMFTLLFSGGYGAYTISHNAMGYEMTGDYDERTHLFKWRLWAVAIAGFLTPWLPRLCLAFEGDQAQILKGAEGVKYVGLLLGGLIITTGLVPVFFCPEGHSAQRRESKVPFLQAVRMTLHNRPFWLLVISNIVTKVGMSVTGIFFFYLVTAHVGAASVKQGTNWWGIYVNVINVSMFLAMAPIASLTDRVGKKSALLVCLGVSVVSYASVWWTMNPGTPWLCLFSAFLIGAFTNPMPMIKNSMLADICDLDELNTGHRREGFFSAVFITSDKLALAFSLTCQGALLTWSGFNAALPIQSPDTIRYWLLAVAITQPLGFLVGIAAIVAYPLTRKRCRAIRQELELRSSRQCT